MEGKVVETLLFGFRWKVLRWVRRDKRLLLGDRPSTRCLDSRPLLTLLPLPLQAIHYYYSHFYH